MSDLISREEAQKALYGCVMPNQHAEDILAEVPSANIIECAKAIKEYCKGRGTCDGCPLDTGFFTCALDYSCPIGWDLLEGGKE